MFWQTCMAVPYAMMMFVVTLCALVASGISSARAETLQDAVTRTLSDHPRVEAARASRSYAAEDVDEQYSALFPQLSLGSTTGRLYGDNSTSRGLSTTRGSGYSYLWEGTITARQRLFDGFEAVSRIDSAAARQESADFELIDIRESLAYAAVQAYLDVLRARSAAAMLIEHRDIVNDYTDRIAQMVEDGGADDSDLQQARDISIVLEGLVIDYLGQIRASENNYLEITGALPEGNLYKPLPRLDLLPPDLHRALSVARDKHPSLMAALLQAKASGYAIEAEQAALYPDLDGELSYFKSDKRDIIGGEAVDARAVLRVNWSFDIGGAQISRINKKRYEHKEALARLRELERAVERQVRQSYSEAETARSALKASLERQNLNRRLFDTRKNQFEGARLSLLQLMQGHNQYFTTRLDVVNAEYRKLAAEFAVLSGLGLLQEAIVAAENVAQKPLQVDEPAMLSAFSLPSEDLEAQPTAAMTQSRALTAPALGSLDPAAGQPSGRVLLTAPPPAAQINLSVIQPLLTRPDP